jgi:TIGR03009 family protein
MRKIGWAALAWLTVSALGAAQDDGTWGQGPPPPQVQPGPYPDQPVVPNDPTFQRRPDRADRGLPPPLLQGGQPGASLGAPGQFGQPDPRDPRFQAPGPPAGGAAYQLPCPFDPPPTPYEEANLDRVLLYWEQSSKGVKTFDCHFTRFDYDPFDFTRRPDEPKVDEGEIRYSAPDKAMFLVKGQKGEMSEQWVCDGKAIYEMDPIHRQMIVHKLAPELQGKAIADGPVPFLFGAKRESLRQRYYMRIKRPQNPAEERKEVCLEAWPKYPADAQNFKYAELILAIGEKSLTPTAVQIHHPNGKNRVSYALRSIAINKSDLRSILESPWWHPAAPSGWQTVVKEPPQGPPNAQPPAARQGQPAVGIRSQNPR